MAISFIVPVYPLEEMLGTKLPFCFLQMHREVLFKPAPRRNLNFQSLLCRGLFASLAITLAEFTPEARCCSVITQSQGACMLWCELSLV